MFIRRLIARIRHRCFADDLDAELREHRALLERDLVRRGLTPDDAGVEAQRVLGRDVAAREDARAVWMPPLFDQTTQDVRFAWRQMRKAPGFALTAIALCALGVGATTAIVSVINALMIVPLPYPDPDRVLALSSTGNASVTGEQVAAVRLRSTALSALAAQRSTGGWSLELGGRAEAVRGLRVSEQYFAVLGVPPQMGRAFTADEDRAPGPAVVVISHDIWQRALGGAPDAIGRSITLSGTPHEVVGVMPARFTSVPAADVWTPLRLSDHDNSLNHMALGRLAPGRELPAAAAELELSKADLLLAQPEPAHQRLRGLSWVPLSRALGAPLTLPLLLLALTATATVGIACANLSGLLLFRTLARGQEMATRLALGGSPARIVRQLLTESLVLAAIGGMAGMLAARAVLPVVASFIPAALLAGRAVTMDATVIALSILATLTITIAFGLAPALTTRRFELTGLTSQRTHTTSRRQSWVRRSVLIGEIAATTTLVLIGVMLARTLVQAYRADLGFNPEAVTVGHLSLPESFGAQPERFASFADRTLARLRENPAVLSAALANHVPIERGLNLAVEPPPGGRVAGPRAVDWRYVTPDYFDTLGMRLARGRGFDDRDRAGSTPVAIVNEAFARTYFGDADALFRSVTVASVGDLPREIVGIVRDAAGAPGSGWTSGLSARGSAPPPVLFVPLPQAPPQGLQIAHRVFPAAVVVRLATGAGDPARLVEDAVHGVDPTIAFTDIVPMTRVAERDVRVTTVLSSLVGSMAALALLIAGIGVYGLVAYSTVQRRQETAIRVALGARRGSLLRAFVGETATLSLAGISLGMALSWALTRVITTSIGRVVDANPVNVAVSAVVVLTVLGVAALWPAARAAAKSPLSVLRIG